MREKHQVHSAVVLLIFIMGTLGLIALPVRSTVAWPVIGRDKEVGENTGSQATAAAQLPEVRLDGNYFSHGGRRFLVLGAHWVPAKAAMHWPLQWDPREIEADFAKMRELGFNTVRFDLMWAWFEPRPGDYNPEAFRQLDFLISLAHRYQIYLHPTFFIGGEVGEAYWDVPWRHGRHPHADAEMLRLQTDHAAEFARRYGSESAILAWDLTDEPPYWIVQGSTTDAMAINWTRLICGAIRRHDTLHPLVVGTSQEDINHGPFRPDNISREVDFFSVHPYTIYVPDLFPDPMVSERGTYGAAFQTALSSSAGRPAIVGELGASSAQYTPERIALYERMSLYSSLAAGSNGFLLWCYTDAAPEQYRKVPYLRSPHETQFGLTTWDRQDRPQGLAFKEFQQIVSRMDLSGVEPAFADAGIIVPMEWAKPHGDFSRSGLTGPEITPYVSVSDGDAMPGQSPPNLSEANQWLRGSWLNAFILARRSGLKVDFPREGGSWEKRAMVFLPSPLTSTNTPLVHVHSDYWAKAENYVRQGGSLYASVCADAAIPGMESLFGARLLDAAPVSEVTLKIVEPFGELKPGQTFHYVTAGTTPKFWGAQLEVKGGKIIAVDQFGRPALVTNVVGSGKTLLCAYPLETYLANLPAVFDKPEETHRLYQAFRHWAGVKPVVWTDVPSVESSALNATRQGYIILVNHSPQAQVVKVSTALPVHSLRQLVPQGFETILLDGANWTMKLEPYSGAVVEWN